MSMDILTPLARQMEGVLSCIRAEYDRSLRDTELSAVQATYILTICQNPRQTQDALSRALSVNGSSITRQLSDLEAKGYVRRVPNAADRRERLVEPTDRAFELLPRLVEIRNDCQAALLRGFSPEEQELLGELLSRLSRNADRHSAAALLEGD